MTLDLTRRKFLIGIGLIGIAPVIVKAESIMRVRPVDPMDDLPMTASEVLYRQQLFLGDLDRALVGADYNFRIGDLVTTHNILGIPSKQYVITGVSQSQGVITWAATP